MSLSLELQNISFRYTGIGASDMMVLQELSLRLGGNECAAIVGPSGSGKTTLIQQFTGLLRPVSGKVLVDGQDIWQRSFSQDALRKRISLVFQFPENQLFEETVAKDVGFGPQNLSLPDSEIDQRVTAAMKAVDLDRQIFGPRSPFRLSEGEKRRVAIAGVLAMNPEMVVFDEPTAGLDPNGTERMESIIKRLKVAGKSIVVISHNMDFVAQIADRIIVMMKGQIAFDGSPKNLFADQVLLGAAGLQVPEIVAALREFPHPKLQNPAAITTMDELLVQLSAAGSEISPR